MKIYKKIKLWLSTDSSLKEGIELFTITGGDSKLVRRLSRYLIDPFGVPDKLKESLKEKLRAYLELYAPPEKEVNKAAIVDMPINNQPIDEELAHLPVVPEIEKDNSVPDGIIKLRKRQIVLYDKYRAVKEEMYNVDSNTANEQQRRAALAEQILEVIMPEIKSVSETLLEWEETGELPLIKMSEDVQLTVQMMQKRESLRSGISRLKKQSNKNGLLVAKVKEIETTLTNKQRELDILNYQLGFEITTYESIFIIGNIASGKTSFSNQLQKVLKGFKVVCIDEKRHKVGKDSNLKDYLPYQREEVAQRIYLEDVRSKHKVILPLVGSTKFYEKTRERLTKADYKPLIIKINCSPSVCIQRYWERKNKGYISPPLPYKSKSIENLINKYDAELKHIAADLVLNSESQTNGKLIEIFVSHFKNIFFT